MAIDLSSDKSKAAAATPSDLTPMPPSPDSAPSKSRVQDLPSLTATAPSMPSSTVQCTPSHRGHSPFMPTFTSPFGVLGKIITNLWSRGQTDVVAQTQVSKQDTDGTGPTITLPNRLKRGRTPEMEEPAKRFKRNDHGTDSNYELHAQLTKYPPDRTLRVDGIHSNATKEELVFYFRRCPTNEIEYFSCKEGTSGYALAIFRTVLEAHEAMQQLGKRKIFGMDTSIKLIQPPMEEGSLSCQKATTISTSKQSLPAHLSFPSHYHPLANTFPDLEAAIEEGREAAQKSVAEKRRLYIIQLPFGTTEDAIRSILKNYSTETIAIPYNTCAKQLTGYYAFVDFASIAEAARAKKELHRVQFSDRELGVTAEPNAFILHEPTALVIRPKKRRSLRVQKEKSAVETAAPIPYEPTALKTSPMDKDSPCVQMDNPAVETTASIPSEPTSPETKCVKKKSLRVQMDNLAFETTEDDIRHLLQEYSPTAVVIQKYALTSCPTGSAFIDLRTPAEARHVIAHLFNTMPPPEYTHITKKMKLSIIEDEQSTTFAPDLPTSAAHIPNSEPSEQFYALSLDINARNYDPATLKEWWRRERGVWLDI